MAVRSLKRPSFLVIRMRSLILVDPFEKLCATSPKLGAMLGSDGVDGKQKPSCKVQARSQSIEMHRNRHLEIIWSFRLESTEKLCRRNIRNYAFSSHILAWNANPQPLAPQSKSPRSPAKLVARTAKILCSNSSGH